MKAPIIYVFQAIFLQYGLGVEWFKLLPGAIERNIATLFHTALTFIAAWVLVKGVKYIMIPISFHALANIYATLMLQVTKDPWIIEGFIGLLFVPLSVILILIVHGAILEKSKGLETVFLFVGF